MSSEFQSFDEYWSLFLLRSRPVAYGRPGLGRTGLGLARVALVTLAARRRRAPRELRWAVAATLLSWGKVLAGTFEDELAEAVRAEAARWPAVDAVAALGAGDSPRGGAPRTQAPRFAQSWAVWM